ncbi:hypothetical protein OP10G_4033 [Fimbriimonas ginsengisoli Gsoil 348]|uniref:Uncharacterized protein n=1 Tax=Fimbriimonas ginsengisoli Gsoil 348 TaxID=661478 RepID=A0A068NVC5_FIMGI|nr:hypothetical protein OP10G_4033 [Fimbriimonas ginsengisoli Gsoil 348]
MKFANSPGLVASIELAATLCSCSTFFPMTVAANGENRDVVQEGGRRRRTVLFPWR